jgi:hypothetical protein
MEGTHLLLVVTRMALELAQKVLPPYSHPKSQHQFTQPQLLACLIVKAYCDRAIGASSICWPCRMVCGGCVRSGWRLMRAMVRNACTSFVGSDGV